MSQPLQPKNDPNKQVMIGTDDDISLDAVTTKVELRESGIAACYLTANNDEGKLYLESLHLNDRVVVKLVPDSAPPTAINWAIINPVFDGKIQELSPMLSVSGQACQVVAYGKGFQLKEMRVSKQYGFITPVLGCAYTNHFDATIHEWNSSAGYHRGTAPYVGYYSGLGFPWVPSFLYLYHCIFSELYGYGNKAIGAFTFEVPPEYDGGEFTSAELHIVAAIYNNGGGYPTSVTIKPYWTVDIGDNPTWYGFTAGNFTPITAQIDAYSFNNPAWSTYGDINYYYNSNYNPLINALHGPPCGEDLHIHIDVDLPYWNKNLKVKLEIFSVAGSVVGGVTINSMFIKYMFKETSGKTVRELIAGDNGTVGIIPSFVDTILDGILSSGYTALNTDYVVKDDITDITKLIPFIKFPYEDALTVIQDIIKYGSALRFLNNSGGYHWKIDTDGNLLVAFTTDHDVAGVDGGHVVSSKWILSPYATPIKVKQEMITQEFKQQIPIANYVLVAGKFHYPLNDNICRGLNIGYWRYAGGSGLFGTRVTVLIDQDLSSYTPCLEFQPIYDTLGVEVVNIYAYPLLPDISILDLTRLMGYNTSPTISFWLKLGGGISNCELRLYPEDPLVPNNPWWNNFYSIPLTDVGGVDIWKFIEVTLPNTAYQKDYDNWIINTDALFGLAVASIDWQDMKTVKYWGIKFDATTIVPSAPYVRMRNFSINGTVIRGAYDSASITAYGCRMITVKDSMASTDTLNVNDNKSALVLEAVYDLQRYRRLRLTGEISIPLDPVWQEGQLVWVQTEDFLPVGASYSSASGPPTEHTVGTVGSYYIDSVDDEVFLCTAITDMGSGHYHYTWVDQNVVRYKINKWFRITKVIHEFTAHAAMTILSLTDDYYSSLTVDTRDVYTVLMRINTPDFQSKSFGSLKSSGDFDLGLPVITKDYTSFSY